MIRRSYFWQLALAAVATLVLAAGLVGAGGCALAQEGATLTTDKPDYAPGETAILAGAGFASGEPIDFSIAIEDPETGLWIADWEWAEGYCDEQGAFTAYYLVPDAALARNLKATAMGLNSALMAAAAFADNPPGPKRIFRADLTWTPDPLYTGTLGEFTVVIENTLGSDPGVVLGSARITVNPNFTVDEASITVTAPGSKAWSGVLEGGQDQHLALSAQSDASRLDRNEAITVRLEATAPDTAGQYPWPVEAWEATDFDTHAFAKLSPSPKVTVEEAPEQECPTNAAPTITASPAVAEMSDLVGCLAGSAATGYTLSKDAVAVSGVPASWLDLDPATHQATVSIAFTASDPLRGLVSVPVTLTVSDPEGDPVLITADVSSVTLLGPGLTDPDDPAYVVTFTAIDDPSARNVGGCPLLEGGSATAAVTVHGRVIYKSVVFVPPLSSSATLVKKVGAVVPAKFRFYDGCGNEITDLNLPVSPYAGANDNPNPAYPTSPTPWIDVQYWSGAAPVVPTNPTVEPTGSANDDSLFRYTDALWMYNLDTNTSYGYQAGSTYKIDVYLNDGTTTYPDHAAFLSMSAK